MAATLSTPSAIRGTGWVDIHSSSGISGSTANKSTASHGSKALSSNSSIHLCLLLGLTPCLMSASTATLSAFAAAAHTLSLSGSCRSTPSNPLFVIQHIIQ
jgi:hypothetical protein